MTNSDRRSGSSASATEHEVKCDKCGATMQLDTGGCVSCLLREGLQGGDEVSQAFYQNVLAEVDAPHKSWLLGNYEILEEIGRGGMGVIYRARQRHSQRIVAVKRILTYRADSHEALERFRREAQAVASLDHANILPIYEVSEGEDGVPFFSMKLAEKGSLRENAASLRDQPRKCVQLMAKVARAVDYAHGRGVLHRDLKPGNILLDDRGEPLVSDFGLAKLLDANKDLTRSLTTFGTAGYIAPEQTDGAGADNTSAGDVYSLGAILFSLLAGRAPFLGSNPLSVIRQASETPAPKLRSLAPSLDRDLETICSRCLERDPKARYQSAGDLAVDLERWLDRRPIVARPVSPPVRIWRWSRRNPKLVGAGVAGLLLGAAAVWLFRGELFRASEFNPPDRSIAVLPFTDLSETKDQEYFCEGISEEILHTLAKVDGLRVVGRASSFSFKADASPREIGQKLNVGNVVEGSLRREGNRVRVTAELIDARNGFRVWTESYDRESGGVFELQDEIARSIVDALKIKLAVPLSAREQSNAGVYDLYLQGLYFSNKSSEEDLRRALDFFQRAVEKDPNFAPAWTGIAKVWYFLANVYVRPLDAYPASREAAMKALALNDKDAEAHCYLSEAKRVLDWDLAGADAELKRALQLAPNSAPAHLFSGLHPLFRGDLKEGLRLVLEAKKLDPVSPITSYVTTAAYLANNQLDDAITEGQRTLQLDPNYFYLDSVVAAAYREKKNFPEAIDLYMKSQEATHLPSSGLAITYARMNQQTDAQNILTQLVQARERRYVSAPLIAAVCTALGDTEGAFRWLERAYEEHSGVLQWVAFLPEFRALHSDKRFPNLLRRIGASQDTILAITETTLSKISDPNAQSHLNLKVGVRPRPGTQNGHVVRIKVDFYDLTKDNKLRPTNAQVSYNWLSSARDWTDATPKFLAATYVRPKSQPPSSDERRYGGFVVSVYFDGQLQDSRASSPELSKLAPAEN
jgi:eukaryotic-like serine/threonine-protein kinase